jgi:hypothetical protein
MKKSWFTDLRMSISAPLNRRLNVATSAIQEKPK